ncbi:MAG: glycosyltransferase [Ktedonobacteraceae bacterium]|nr:glycosyltransferase [Ktedonobacteraceae bacterium]
MTTRPYRHSHSIPAEILALSHERDILRRRGQYARADLLKRQIEDAGYVVKDNPHGAHLVILPSIEVDGRVYRTARQLPSLVDEADLHTFSVIILAHNTFEQTRRCVTSVLHYAGNTDLEIMLIDNASQDGLDQWAETLRHEEPRLHLLRTSRSMGIAEAYNAGLKQSRGRYILLLDTTLEVTGDIFSPLAQTLSDRSVGTTGLHGLRTDDLRHFSESQEHEVEAIDYRCMAFRRHWLRRAGLLDERYRFPRFMDIDFNFALLDQGAHNLVTPHLPIIQHTDSGDAGLSDAERTRLTKRNFYRFLEKWGGREDLLIDA